MQNRNRAPGGVIIQPLGATAYALLSFFSLAIALFVGWYLLSRKDLAPGGIAASRAYFVLLTILGLSVAAFLFGVLRSTARLTGNALGPAVDLGGPIVAAVLVVWGGYYLTRQPEEFSLYVRLKSDALISAAADATVAIDFETRQDRQKFSDLGVAAFPAVPVRYKGQNVSLQFESRTYRLIDPKPQYQIPESELIVLNVQKISEGPKVSDVCDGSPIVQLKTFGWAAFEKHNFDAAERIANSLKQCDSKDFVAYNILGAVAFYRQLYDVAVDQFAKALEVAPPNMPDLTNNLGDALVELALQSSEDRRRRLLSKALSVYQDGYVHSEASDYKIARALLFSGEIDPALSHIKLVSSTYDYEAAAGKARILEGAIYLQSVKSSPEKIAQLRDMAKAAFAQGYNYDPSFWKEIFAGNKFNAPEPYGEIKKIYGSNAAEWMTIDKAER